jgi:hypothetical protein
MIGDYRKTVSCARFHLRHGHGGDAFLAADEAELLKMAKAAEGCVPGFPT